MALLKALLMVLASVGLAGCLVPFLEPAATPTPTPVAVVTVAATPTLAPTPTPVPRVLVGACGEIGAPGSYALAGNVAARAGEACLVVNASDVVLDCRGFAFAGAGGGEFGVLVTEVSNVTLANCVARGFANGIQVIFSDGVRVVRGTFSGNDNGVSVRGGTGLLVTESRFEGNGVGLVMTRAREATVARNAFRANRLQGALLRESVANWFAENVFRENGVGLNVFSQSRDNVLEDNDFCGNSDAGVRCISPQAGGAGNACGGNGAEAAACGIACAPC